MMEELDRHRAWEEPMVGRLFGEFHDQAQKVDLRRPDFIMANASRKVLHAGSAKKAYDAHQGPKAPG